ncbi:hypothetical protein G3J81_004862 [Salmonella enterica]|nr:hypothetical protein [Salmonella enterica]
MNKTKGCLIANFATVPLFPRSKPLSIPGKDNSRLRFRQLCITEKMISKRYQNEK